MARPPSQGQKAVASDVQVLTRILNRIERDTHRPAKQQAELVGHLKSILQILLLGERTGLPAKKAG
jgi:hypothetical protein